MNDRYIKTMLTITALSTLSIAISLATRTSPVVEAQSSVPKEECVWTYILDAAKPGIGQDGEVEFNGKNWQAVSEGGWRLVGPIDGATGYLFERCE